MISEILIHIFVDRLSWSETAKIMGISVQQLKDRMRLIEQMGYIKKADKDCYKCGLCSSYKVCEACYSDLSSLHYILTDKGLKLIRKS
jgi:predicted transcriptional regulator